MGETSSGLITVAVSVGVVVLLVVCVEHVAPYKRLRGGVFIIDHIARTGSGKVIRRLLAKYTSPDFRHVDGENDNAVKTSSKL